MLENSSNRPDDFGHIHHFYTVRDVLETQPACLESLPGAGEKTLKLILTALADKGFKPQSARTLPLRKEETPALPEEPHVRVKFAFKAD